MKRKAASPPARGQARPPAPRTAAAIAATALALLAAACAGRAPGGSGGAPGVAGETAGSASAVAYSACMRSHGVPSYPDPDSSGQLPKGSAQTFGVSSPQFSAARRACQHLLPAAGGPLTASSLQQCYLAGVCPQALVQQALTAGRNFARCMRAHGAPNWPDPSIDSQGRPLFSIQVPNPAPPQISAAISECSRLEHAGSLLAWGSQHSSAAGKGG